MPWLRKKLGPQVRDEPDAQEAQQARDEAAQRGELGVFDTQASEQAAAAGPPKAGGKRKPWAKEGVVQEARKPVEKATEVRGLWFCFFGWGADGGGSSINIRRRRGRFRTAS